ncbi:MAG: OmpA family protein [Salinivirgaceae bacterium]|jgi:chemotaxis protein MotB|nr:OmpA family protein [Salinivirgaceae bacterium]
MQKIVLVFAAAILLGLFTNCVPTRQFQELKGKNEFTVHERDSLQDRNESLTVRNTEMEAELEELKRRMENLAINKSSLKDSAHFYKKQYKVFKTMYDDLTSTNENVQKGRDKETRLLLAELQVTKEDLQMQEDELRLLETSLIEQQKELNERDVILIALDSTLNQKRLEIEDQSKRLFELEGILHSKDSAVLAIKSKITDALLGFENKGLTIHQRNGKVYVTMDEKLLFQSGRWDVDPKGQQAIMQIAGVLEQNKNINILIEGHTDDVPMRGSGDVKDNWDLSAKRATSIVKILLQNSTMNPIRVTAAGRGPFMPIDSSKTPEARAKNRRTEIILTPKLDELFQILESN